jgi:FkbM family methyltransferase
MLDFNHLPYAIRSSIDDFCRRNNISNELIDFWDNSDNGIFVSKSERFFASLNFKKGDPVLFYKDPPPVADPSKVNDSRKLVYVIYEHLSKYMGKNPIILDVGGFIGRFSVESAKLLKYLNVNDTIYIFEPGLTVPLIKANLGINSVADIVEVNNVAVTNKAGVATYQLEKDNMISGNLCKLGKADLTFKVPTIKLDDFLKERAITAPLIVKIDTEGLEAEVIDGLYDYEEFFSSVYIIEFWKGYLEYDMRGKRFIDFVHDNFLVYNIRSSLYPAKVSAISDLRIFADNFDIKKGNIDLLLIPKNIVKSGILLDSLAARGLI